MFGRTRARSRERGHGGALWSPLALSTTRLWLRADLGITLNSTTVSAWANQYTGSGAWGNATQATGANQPTYRSSVATFNGMPAVEGDGTNDVLAGTTTFAGSTLHLFVVFRTLVIPTNAGLFALTKAAESDNSSANLLALYEVTGPNIHLFRNNQSNSVAGPAQNVAGIAMAKFDGALATIKVGANSSTFATSGAFGPTGYQLLARWLGSANFWINAQIAEVIAFEGNLATAEETRLRAYLSTRYGGLV